jgi:hypothetical protein
MHVWCREPACSVDETEICKIPLEPSWIKTARSNAKRGTCILVFTKNWKAERNGILSKDETYILFELQYCKKHCPTPANQIHRQHPSALMDASMTVSLIDTAIRASSKYPREAQDYTGRSMHAIRRSTPTRTLNHHCLHHQRQPRRKRHHLPPTSSHL